MKHLAWKNGAGYSCSCEVGADHPAVAEIDLTSDWQVGQLAECHARYAELDVSPVERMHLALEEFVARGVA